MREEKQQLSVYIPNRLFRKVEAGRGKGSRTGYVTELLETYFGEQGEAGLAARINVLREQSSSLELCIQAQLLALKALQIAQDEHITREEYLTWAAGIMEIKPAIVEFMIGSTHPIIHAAGVHIRNAAQIKIMDMFQGDSDDILRTGAFREAADLEKATFLVKALTALEIPEAPGAPEEQAPEELRA